MIALEWCRGRVFDQSIADMFIKMMMKETHLQCTSVKSSESRKSRPKPMNTVELLKIASKSLGIGPHTAMKSAENLYLSGFISYPRTESTSYPSSFDIKDALRTQLANPRYGDYVRSLLSNGYTSPHHGHDAGDNSLLLLLSSASSSFILSSSSSSSSSLPCRRPSPNNLCGLSLWPVW